MTTQNYLVVENNVVTNCVIWDGDLQQWQPPSDATMLIQTITPSKIWQLNTSITPVDYELIVEDGKGAIGFTWDGSIVTTNEPKPQIPVPASIQNQPVSIGTLTA